jgi:hypothetical protein
MNIKLVGDQWNDLTALSGIALNTAFAFQNLSSNTLIAEESATKPADGNYNGTQLAHLEWRQSAKHAQKVWLRPVNGNGEVFVEAL